MDRIETRPYAGNYISADFKAIEYGGLFKRARTTPMPKYKRIRVKGILLAPGVNKEDRPLICHHVKSLKRGGVAREYSGIMIFDFDKGSKTEETCPENNINAFLNNHKDLSNIMAITESCSGYTHAWVKLTVKPKSEYEFKALYEHIAKTLFPLDVCDKSCNSPMRFIYFDNSIRHLDECAAFDSAEFLKNLPPEHIRAMRHIKGGKLKNMPKSKITAKCKNKFGLILPEMIEGKRYQTCRNYLSAAKRRGASLADMLELGRDCIRPGFTREEIKRICYNIEKGFKPELASVAKCQSEERMLFYKKGTEANHKRAEYSYFGYEFDRDSGRDNKLCMADIPKSYRTKLRYKKRYDAQYAERLKQLNLFPALKEYLNSIDTSEFDSSESNFSLNSNSIIPRKGMLIRNVTSENCYADIGMNASFFDGIRYGYWLDSDVFREKLLI